MNATLLCLARLVPGYGEKDIVKRIKDAGGDVVLPEEKDPNINRARTRYSHLGVVVEMPANFEDEDLDQLCEIRRLAVLSFPGRQVSDDGLRTVSELRGLILLGLDGASISDSGLRNLEKMSTLRGLYLRGCPNVTEEGVAQLQKALPNCKVVR
jgi:hypothetical protein